MDTTEFLMQFQDHVAPRLDTYEQVIYLYVVRHSRLVGRDDVVIGFQVRKEGHGFGDRQGRDANVRARLL